MCATCGCSDDTRVRITGPNGSAEHHHHDHPHPHEHGQDHGPPGAGERTILLEQKVLARNDELARENRRWLAERGVRAVNVMSSPGSGKTTLLERTVRDLGAELPLSVIEGDQATLFDADRIRAAGARAVQVNTGAGCHLDADMLASALRHLDPPAHSVVFIENVGNLVCPALFDLGEQSRVVLASVTEGADKPLKYPHMFATADLVLLNKVDLLPYVDFDLAEFRQALSMTTARARVLELSVTQGIGLPRWYEWLRFPSDRTAIAVGSDRGGRTLLPE